MSEPVLNIPIASASATIGIHANQCLLTVPHVLRMAVKIGFPTIIDIARPNRRDVHPVTRHY